MSYIQFFQFLRISFLELLKEFKMNDGIFIMPPRFRGFLRCQKKLPLVERLMGQQVLDILERSQNCILLSPFAMHFLLATLLSTFSLDAKVSAKIGFIHSNESQFHVFFLISSCSF